jgi:uncharacterized protein YndB with AHSA1/START domain
MQYDPKHDLVLERTIKAKPATLWRCWTEPELLKEWFCPKPWRVTRCEIDLRAGGTFLTVMAGPDGKEMEAEPGCFLLVEPEKRLVFGDAMAPGFRPRESPFMVADVSFAPAPEGCAYRAHVMHTGPEKRKQHEEMGFHDGWGTAAQQLEDFARSLEG